MLTCLDGSFRQCYFSARSIANSISSLKRGSEWASGLGVSLSRLPPAPSQLVAFGTPHASSLVTQNSCKYRNVWRILKPRFKSLGPVWLLYPGAGGIEIGPSSLFDPFSLTSLVGVPCCLWPGLAKESAEETHTRPMCEASSSCHLEGPHAASFIHILPLFFHAHR